MIILALKRLLSNGYLAAIMDVMTKVKMLDICKKFELYVSPNLR